VKKLVNLVGSALIGDKDKQGNVEPRVEIWLAAAFLNSGMGRIATRPYHSIDGDWWRLLMSSFPAPTDGSHNDGNGNKRSMTFPLRHLGNCPLCNQFASHEMP
jgi:hypothetical protein